MFDNLQLYAMFCRGRGSVVIGVALIDIGQLHVLASNFLYGLSQRLDLGTILLVGCGHMQRAVSSRRWSFASNRETSGLNESFLGSRLSYARSSM